MAIKTSDPKNADAVSARLNSSDILPQNATARSWGDLLPQLKEYVGLAEGMGWFLISLIGVFAALGVLNTMMMAVFERTREIGMLHSLGMSPASILMTLLAESLFLGVLGLTAGLRGERH